MDYLNPKARDIWSTMYHYENYPYSTPNLYAWNDMNEPAVFFVDEGTMPKDNLQLHVTPDGKEHQVEHRLVHNIYGLLNAKATYKGLLERNKDQNDRPHNLCRSFFAGSQKYCTVWTADTICRFDYLEVTVPMLLSIALCGISFCGGDVGGFLGDPAPELAIRWFQLGSFMPFFRGHSSKWCGRREPYSYEEKYTDIIRDTILTRYKFLPYWYTEFEKHTRTGVPIIRPLWVNYPDVDSSELISEEHKLFVGDALFIIPVLKEGVTTIDKPLNTGLEKDRWYDYYELNEVFGDKALPVDLDKIGILIRGGHIIPNFQIDK